MQTKFYLKFDRVNQQWVLLEFFWYKGEKREREVLRDQSLPVMKAHLMAYSRAGVSA